MRIGACAGALVIAEILPAHGTKMLRALAFVVPNRNRASVIATMRPTGSVRRGACCRQGRGR